MFMSTPAFCGFMLCTCVRARARARSCVSARVSVCVCVWLLSLFFLFFGGSGFRIVLLQWVFTNLVM